MVQLGPSVQLGLSVGLRSCLLPMACQFVQLGHLAICHSRSCHVHALSASVVQLGMAVQVGPSQNQKLDCKLLILVRDYLLSGCQHTFTSGPVLVGHCLTVWVSVSPASLSLLHICSARLLCPCLHFLAHLVQLGPSQLGTVVHLGLSKGQVIC